jgi:hypothetical protein
MPHCPPVQPFDKNSRQLGFTFHRQPGYKLILESCGSQRIRQTAELDPSELLPLQTQQNVQTEVVFSR